jgi:hypothetical protein
LPCLGLPRRCRLGPLPDPRPLPGHIDVTNATDGPFLRTTCTTVRSSGERSFSSSAAGTENALLPEMAFLATLSETARVVGDVLVLDFSKRLVLGFLVTKESTRGGAMEHSMRIRNGTDFMICSALICYDSQSVLVEVRRWPFSHCVDRGRHRRRRNMSSPRTMSCP